MAWSSVYCYWILDFFKDIVFDMKRDVSLMYDVNDFLLSFLRMIPIGFFDYVNLIIYFIFYIITLLSTNFRYIRLLLYIS